MSDQVEQVRQKSDIVEIVGEKVTLKKAGRHYKGLCPFHSEKSPSFIVSPERQSYKCFGCGEGGDVFSFLEKYEGMSFLESLETLAKRVGITIESYRPTAQDTVKKRLLTAMDLASEYYHFLLTKHESGEVAREYLKKRGITNEAIKQFKLGWAPNSWRNVSDFLVKKKGYKPEELEQAGMVLAQGRDNFYDRFRGRVMFPLRDHRGIVVGFSGRTLSSDVKEAKYINSPETLLYSKSKMLYGLWENREYIRKEDRVLLVEGELDTIPSWQAGEKAVVAIKGSAFTQEQARLIVRYTKNILMALDADAAGQEAIKRAVNIA
ncbi:MAG: DNA primase [bacterium]